MMGSPAFDSSLAETLSELNTRRSRGPCSVSVRLLTRASPKPCLSWILDGPGGRVLW